MRAELCLGQSPGAGGGQRSLSGSNSGRSERNAPEGRALKRTHEFKLRCVHPDSESGGLIYDRLYSLSRSFRPRTRTRPFPTEPTTARTLTASKLRGIEDPRDEPFAAGDLERVTFPSPALRTQRPTLSSSHYRYVIKTLRVGLSFYLK